MSTTNPYPSLEEQTENLPAVNIGKLIPMEDREIDKMAKKERLKILSQLWVAFGKDIEAERLRIYSNDLDYVPTGLLEIAVKTAIRSQKYHTIPTLRAIEDALCDALFVDKFTELENAISVWVDDSYRRCVYIPVESEIQQDG